MTIKRLAILTAVLALAVMPAAASAAEPPASTPTASGIIAILIGQFTPPIGSDKGSLLDATLRGIYDGRACQVAAWCEVVVVRWSWRWWWGRAAGAGATTTVTLRCAGRDLQPPATAQLNRQPATHHPRSQPLEAGHLATCPG